MVAELERLTGFLGNKTKAQEQQMDVDLKKTEVLVAGEMESNSAVDLLFSKAVLAQKGLATPLLIQQPQQRIAA
jgi:hypothetical protein